MSNETTRVCVSLESFPLSLLLMWKGKGQQCKALCIDMVTFALKTWKNKVKIYKVIGIQCPDVVTFALNQIHALIRLGYFVFPCLQSKCHHV